MICHYVNYSSPDNMRSRLDNAKSEINKDQVYSIKNALTKLKNIVKNVPKNRRFKIEESEKIIDIVERILELNNENQLGEGLKILKAKCIVPISLAQLKVGKNSVKLRNAIRQLLYSLYQSKKLTKNIYKSLVDII